MTLKEAREVALNDKYVYVVMVGSPFRGSKQRKFNEFRKLVARCDTAFKWGFALGNDYYFDKFACEVTGFPVFRSYIDFSHKMIPYGTTKLEELQRYLPNATEKKFAQWEKARKASFANACKQRDEWQKTWGTINFKTSAFETDCISSSCTFGPSSWLLPNGRIEGFNTIGYSPKNCSEIIDDAELFTKEFPELDFYAYIYDREKNVLILHLDAGIVSAVKSSPFDKKAAKIATLQCKNPLPRMSSNYSTFEILKAKLLLKLPFLSESFIDKALPTIREFRAGIYRPTQFFTQTEFIELVDWWQEHRPATNKLI